MTYDKIEGEAKASDAAEAYFKKLADSWYAGWSHKGRTGFMQSLRIAYEMGGMDALSALGTRPEAGATIPISEVANRLRNMAEQYGHPDWSAPEFVQAMLKEADHLDEMAKTAPSTFFSGHRER